ncbi:MAG: hypothetical protein AAF939_03120 [Planctomycetota bacterium]
MIKPLNAPQLTAAKPRAGLNRIGDLMNRLIRHYEMQAELAGQLQKASHVAVVTTGPTQTIQTTFGWED